MIDVDGMAVRIEMDGLLGLCSHVMYWPGFAAHAVDRDKPFLSKTGYRSFHGLRADLEPGLGPASFAAKVIAAYMAENA